MESFKWYVVAEDGNPKETGNYMVHLDNGFELYTRCSVVNGKVSWFLKGNRFAKVVAWMKVKRYGRD